MSGPTRILGCDYGERRTGVAVSDPTGRIAFPAGVVEARTAAEAARRVAALAAEREAAEIVVGMPLLLSGEVGEQARATEAFVELLKAAFGGPVRTWDERLTSAQSQRALDEMGARRGPGGRAERGRADRDRADRGRADSGRAGRGRAGKARADKVRGEKGRVDEVAATLLLQSYLDSRPGAWPSGGP
ncbi:MAG: Holliday junction resolvase RuvX [Candidatus Eisenbacteria bacterium]|nr:Holliday junction resolvase RuvX [Candidatus Eisenbacteria bacterium]